MTYQQLKDTIVKKDNGIMNEKQFNRFILRFALFTLTLTGILLLVVKATIGTVFITAATAIIMIAFFIWMLDWSAESPLVLRRLNTVSKFWILTLVLMIGLFVFFKYIRYI